MGVVHGGLGNLRGVNWATWDDAGTCDSSLKKNSIFSKPVRV